MSVVVSVRISKELKKKIEQLKNIVDWNVEIRRFLEERVKEFYRREKIAEIRRVIEMLPEMPRGSVTNYGRGDRDSN